MEQIDDAERNLGWKEKCDDIPTLCDADVLLAVDHCPQEARFHWGFHPESSVWLDDDRMGSRSGLGLRERRAAAGVCYGWPGAVLRPVRGDDRRRSFLSELRPTVVSRAIHVLLPKQASASASRAAHTLLLKLPAAVASPTRSNPPSELRPPNIVIPMWATEGVR
jgi:hypothetical protein